MPAEEQTTPTTAVSAPARPLRVFPCRAVDRYPFIWVSLSPRISLPNSDQGWSGKGVGGWGGLHGWNETGVDIAEGQLETLHRNHGDKRREKRWRTGGHGEVTFGAAGLHKPWGQS